MAMDVLVERFDVGILGIEAALDGGARAGDIGGTRAGITNKAARRRPPVHRRDLVSVICISLYASSRPRGLPWVST